MGHTRQQKSKHNKNLYKGIKKSVRYWYSGRHEPRTYDGHIIPVGMGILEAIQKFRNVTHI